MWRALLFSAALAVGVWAQAPVVIRVQTDAPGAALPAIWAYVGHDEPNYTYFPHGEKLLKELAALSPVPVHVRVHNLLTSGDGTPALKWGSTGAYREDAAGRPMHNWAILDRIFDVYVGLKMRPLVEIGFMPEALSTHPVPYQHSFPKGGIFTGWAYPPRDYGKWADLVEHWVRHDVARYGAATVRTWDWEVWNEPDIGYWQGTPVEYFTLYDVTVNAVRRALPGARVGGPDATGPANAHAARFLRSFLEHCAHGRNAATGAVGAPLDFVSFHAKGSPRVVAGRPEMGLRQQLRSIDTGMEIVKSFPEFRRLPIILGESDPEGCAACSVTDHPEDAYRNSELYASYTAETVARTLELASHRGMRVAGAVTWAFEFEGNCAAPTAASPPAGCLDHPWFAGYRSLATHGVDKPVLNAFRMLGRLAGKVLPVSNPAALPLDDVLEHGAPGAGTVSAIATRGWHRVNVMVWRYSDDPGVSAPLALQLQLDGLPAGPLHVHRYRIDATHSNAFALWQKLGSPPAPTPTQVAQLEAAGKLQGDGPERDVHATTHTLRLPLTLPGEALELVEVDW